MRCTDRGRLVSSVNIANTQHSSSFLESIAETTLSLSLSFSLPVPILTVGSTGRLGGLTFKSILFTISLSPHRGEQIKSARTDTVGCTADAQSVPDPLVLLIVISRVESVVRLLLLSENLLLFPWLESFEEVTGAAAVPVGVAVVLAVVFSTRQTKGTSSSLITLSRASNAANLSGREEERRGEERPCAIGRILVIFMYIICSSAGFEGALAKQSRAKQSNALISE